MREIVAIINQRGGVGKTTTSINLACGLARKGKRVLLIDLDRQAHSTIGSGIKPGSYQLDMHDVFSKQEGYKRDHFKDAHRKPASRPFSYQARQGRAPTFLWLTASVRQRLKKLPKNIDELFQLLLAELGLSGPVQKDWPHYGKLREDCYHCHLQRGKTTYVAVWRVLSKKARVM